MPKALYIMKKCSRGALGQESQEIKRDSCAHRGDLDNDFYIQISQL